MHAGVGVEVGEAFDEGDGDVSPLGGADDGVEHGAGGEIGAGVTAGGLEVSFEGEGDGVHDDGVVEGVEAVEGNDGSGCGGELVEIGEDAGFVLEDGESVSTGWNLDGHGFVSRGLRQSYERGYWWR